MKDKEEKKQRIAAVDRTVDILSALGTGQNRTIRDLGNELNITKSTLHRLLQTLEDRGMVKKMLLRRNMPSAIRSLNSVQI